MRNWTRIKEKQLQHAEYIIEKAKSYEVDFCDVILVEDETMSISVRKQELDNLEMSNNNSFGLRIIKDKKQAIVSSSNFQREKIDFLIEEAVNMAKFSPIDENLEQPTNSQHSINEEALDLFDPREVTEEELTNLALECERIAIDHPKIINSEGAGAENSKACVTHYFSNGFKRQIISSISSLSVSVIAQQNDSMERDNDYVSKRYFSDIKNIEMIAKNAQERAVRRLEPKKISTCKAPVIFSPRVSVGILGKFLNAINGNLISQGSSFLKDLIGKQIFCDKINIIEDPHILKGFASKYFDAEGNKTNKKLLVENGILNGYLLDLKNAKKLGMSATGNSTRSLSSSVGISPTNVYLENGLISEADLIKTIKYGIYIDEVFGSKVNLITGDYSQGAFGFLIENGSITHPISEFTVASNLQYMFKNMRSANNLEMKNSINAPSLLIEEMTIAGS